MQNLHGIIRTEVNLFAHYRLIARIYKVIEHDISRASFLISEIFEGGKLPDRGGVPFPTRVRLFSRNALFMKLRGGKLEILMQTRCAVLT